MQPFPAHIGIRSNDYALAGLYSFKKKKNEDVCV